MVEAGKAGVKYLKDWHFVKATQNDPPLYEYVTWDERPWLCYHTDSTSSRTPEYFQDDWLNWLRPSSWLTPRRSPVINKKISCRWWDRKDSRGDDYRFVYIGGRLLLSPQAIVLEPSNLIGSAYRSYWKQNTNAPRRLPFIQVRVIASQSSRQW
jgi:hypothetical protein